MKESSGEENKVAGVRGGLLETPLPHRWESEEEKITKCICWGEKCKIHKSLYVYKELADYNSSLELLAVYDQNVLPFKNTFLFLK